MIIIGDGIMLGAGGESASIFVTGLSETDSVSAKKDRKTVTGKWVSKPNPVSHRLPDGYTELAYIKSSGTQYFNLNADISNGWHFKADVSFDESKINGFFGCENLVSNVWGRNDFSYGSQYGHFIGIGGYKTSNTYSFGNRMTFDVCNIQGSVFVKQDGNAVAMTEQSADTGYRYPGNAYLLYVKAYQNSIYDAYSKATLYSFKLYSTPDDSQLIRDLVPSKRNYDSVIGLYDLVSGNFFTNSGTGTFIAGAEVPQTIDGFEIAPIKSYGTWTVTATDGTKTATQDVLVDVITEYEIEMSLSA